MGNLIDGKKIAEQIVEQTAHEAAVLMKQGHQPKLAVVLIGDDKPSAKYVSRKEKAAQKAGIAFELYHLPASVTQDALLKQLADIQQRGVDGLIVQLPIPEHLDAQRIVNSIDPSIDVDCLTDVNLGRLLSGMAHLVPPTPGAILSILEHEQAVISGARIAMVGAGKLVGKPLALLLTQMGATVTVCNSKTKNLADICLASDIIISAVGKKHLIRADMVAPDAVVIDAGVSFEDGIMYGDVDVDAVLKKARAVTPTPGGVGPLTVARLLWNTVLCAKNRVQQYY